MLAPGVSLDNKPFNDLQPRFSWLATPLRSCVSVSAANIEILAETNVTGTTRLPVVAVQMPPGPPGERDLYEELLVSTGAVQV
jgi:hypothetical protein